MVSAGVSLGNILGPLLYPMYTTDILTTENTVLGTLAGDTEKCFLKQFKKTQIIIIYQSIRKLIWTYGIKFWG